MPRHDCVLGVPEAGFWREILNSDATAYGGSGIGNLGGVEAQPVPWHGRPYTVNITAPPLAVVLFRHETPGEVVTMRVWPGSPHPLGATWDGEGVNFALFSSTPPPSSSASSSIPTTPSPASTVTMPTATDRVWHCYLPDARPGQPLRLPGRRALGSASTGTASTRPSSSSTRTPRR